MLETWSRAIPRADRQITNRDHVCELHFAPHFIIRNFRGECYKTPRVDKMPTPDVTACYVFFRCLVVSLHGATPSVVFTRADLVEPLT
jgi:hypothetical protein